MKRLWLSALLMVLAQLPSHGQALSNSRGLQSTDSPTITGTYTFNNTSLQVKDTANDNEILLKPSANEAADRILSIPTLGADRTMGVVGVNTAASGANSDITSLTALQKIHLDIDEDTVDATYTFANSTHVVLRVGATEATLPTISASNDGLLYIVHNQSTNYACLNSSGGQTIARQGKNNNTYYIGPEATVALTAYNNSLGTPYWIVLSKNIIEQQTKTLTPSDTAPIAGHNACDTSTGSFTTTMPSRSTYVGQVISFKNISADGTNSVTITGTDLDDHGSFSHDVYLGPRQTATFVSAFTFGAGLAAWHRIGNFGNSVKEWTVSGTLRPGINNAIATGGNVLLTFPNRHFITGEYFLISRRDNSTNTVTIAHSEGGNQIIDVAGVSNASITLAPFETVLIVPDNDTVNGHFKVLFHNKRPPITIRKTADETVNNSTVLQNDDTLTFTVATNENWEFEQFISYTDASAAGVADLKLTVVGPAGSTIKYTVVGLDSVDVFRITPTLAGATTTTGGGSTTERNLLIKGVIANGGTAGNCALQWAQNTVDVSDLKVKENSFLTARRF